MKWMDDHKQARSRWTDTAKNRVIWKKNGEAYIQKWTVKEEEIFAST